MAISIGAEWEGLFNRYYRRQEVYTMCWNSVDLSRHKVACARSGGPIAMVRDESKRAKLLLFSSSGKLLSSVPWDRRGGRLIALGWTNEDILLAVVHDGTIFQYNNRGDLILEQLWLGQEVWEQGVAGCIIWGSGLVVITEHNQLFSIPNWETRKVVKLADTHLEHPPHCMAVVEPQYTLSGKFEVLLAVGSSVLMVDADNVQDQMVEFGPIQKMALSWNGNFLACFTHDGSLLVVLTDFSRTLLKHSTESALPPEQLVWCGVDSVLIYWKEQLVMVGPYGDTVKFSYDEPIVLIPECDGIRILSNTYMEFLRRVPDSTVSTLKIGSTSPAAKLYGGPEYYHKRSAKADENIRLMSDKLREAVGDSVNAAGRGFDIPLQRPPPRPPAYGQHGLGSPSLRSRPSKDSPYLGAMAEESQLRFMGRVEERGNSYERDHGGVVYLSRPKMPQSPRLGVARAASESITSRSLGSLNLTELTLTAAAAAVALRSPHKRPPAYSRSPLLQSEDLGKRIEALRLDGGRSLEGDLPGRRLTPWHSQGFEKVLPEVSNFSSWLEDNAQFSKQLEAPKEKKSLWNWKPFRAIAHIGQQRFNCMFTVHVHGIEGLPAVMNGLRLAVQWKRKDAQAQSMPVRVFQGQAEFEETLNLKSHVFGTKDGTKGMKFEPKNFDLAVIALDVDELVLGKHRLDLSRLLSKTTEDREVENDRTWTTSFKLAGKAKGGILIVTFGCQLLNKYSEPTTNLSSARFDSPMIKPLRSYNSLPSSPEGTTRRGWPSDIADYSPAMSEFRVDGAEYMKMEHLSLNDEYSPYEDGHSSSWKSSQKGLTRPSFIDDDDFPGTPKKLSYNQPSTPSDEEDLTKTLYDEDDGSEFNVVYQGLEISAIMDTGPPLVEYDDPKADEDTVEGLSDGDADADADADVHEDSMEDSAIIQAQTRENVLDNAKILSDGKPLNIEQAEPSNMTLHLVNSQALKSDSDNELPQGGEVLVSGYSPVVGIEPAREYKSENRAVGKGLENNANDENEEENVVEIHEDWSEGIVDDLDVLTRSWSVGEPASKIEDPLLDDNEDENSLSLIVVESKENEKTTNTIVLESNGREDKIIEVVEPMPTPSLQVKTKEEDVDAGADEDDYDLVAGEFLNFLRDERGSVACSSESGEDSPRALFLQQLEQEALIEGGLELNFHLPEYAKFRMDGMQDKVDVNSRRTDNQDSPLDSDTLANSDWDNEDDEELAAIMEAAEAELQKATQTLQSRARAKLLDDEETKALMQEWGLNDKTLDAPPSHTSPESSLAIVPLLPAPPLRNALGPVLHFRHRGPRLIQDC